MSVYIYKYLCEVCCVAPSYIQIYMCVFVCMVFGVDSTICLYKRVNTYIIYHHTCTYFRAHEHPHVDVYTQADMLDT